MRILLIGARGFIGPSVIDRLRSSGHSLILFDRGGRQNNALHADLEHIAGDRQNIGAYAGEFRRAQPEVVVDLILSSGRQATELMRTFTGIARRVIAISSLDVYRACGILHGSEPGPLQSVPLTEDSELRTRLETYPPERVKMLQQVFGWFDDSYDKIPVEQAVMSDPHLPGTVLRLPFVYGPGDRLHRLYPILKRVDDGRPTILLDEVVAAFRGPRGYVDNVAAAIALAATDDRASGRIYNVAEQPSYSEFEWTHIVARAAGFRGEIRVVPSAQAPTHLKPPGNWKQHWSADSSRIRHELDYVDPVPLESAVAQTIAWERANPPAQVDPSTFDYQAEDEYLAGLTSKAG
jgi:nucleoside-diphosphate-sugar epimerase